MAPTAKSYNLPVVNKMAEVDKSVSPIDKRI